MGKRAKSGGRLQIHRETLRSLSAQSLKRVAGGNWGTLDDACPRSNGWTAGAGGVYGAEVCGGTVR